ncbi:hypothetical protein [Caldilinea sp.]|jgi:hypothetical protein|uniref:hypothetical protein n=1 Tax=Caldilinea sp. TaxID=2293560 RepID=UPI0005C7125E|nr:hypothetical protein [Caldilinea sp.]MBO9393404.1 hypothetical protein [Caldilinea sp.]
MRQTAMFLESASDHAIGLHNPQEDLLPDYLFLVIALVLQLCYDNYKNYAVVFENQVAGLDRLRNTCLKSVQTPLCKLFFRYQGAGSFIQETEHLVMIFTPCVRMSPCVRMLLGKATGLPEIC